MNFQNNRNYLIIAGGIALILIITIIFVAVSLFTRTSPSSINTSSVTPTSVPYAGTPEIKNISPSNNAKTVNQLDGVIVSFKTPLPNSITLSFSPSVKGAYTRDEKARTITFSPTNGFKTLTTYTATLSINNNPFLLPSNNSVSSYRWSFTSTRQEGESGFSQEENAQFGKVLKQAENTYEDRKKRLPFIIYMPHETTHYTISISAINDTVTITTHGTTQTEIDSYKNEALSWLKANGGNTDALVINYKNSLTSVPTPAP